MLTPPGTVQLSETVLRDARTLRRWHRWETARAWCIEQHDVKREWPSIEQIKYGAQVSAGTASRALVEAKRFIEKADGH
ncbi:hypothetical protein CCAX7_14670 [Capsulimonas corticalis]|uniref:Uncharacterized protein n=1 Tax=Capsulimonas corticalis TaxID=2219043 RepID=A0A402CZE6_9BACT|nr:hypothetical protein [Capsulimonas corticalis]BDI29416.1 hypothetical protein CCAX7_14670 [Capsulimonas corticalis]